MRLPCSFYYDHIRSMIRNTQLLYMLRCSCWLPNSDIPEIFHNMTTIVFHLNYTFSFSFSFFNLTYSRWTSSLPSCLWSQRIFPSLPGSRLTIFYRDASSELLQLVNQWLNFTYSRSHAFRYERKNTNPTLVRIELTNSALAGVQVIY